jgi:hypothetical protein
MHLLMIGQGLQAVSQVLLLSPKRSLPYYEEPLAKNIWIITEMLG